MVKNTIKLCRELFLHKTNKNIQKNRGEMFRTFTGMASLTPSSNFETSQLRENSSLDKSHSQWHKTPKAHLIF